jgi:hypothetical protein
MPLVRARCRACTLPLGDPPATELPVQCARCGVVARVRVGADGQPADFDPAFNETRLLGWMGAARYAMASGHLGVALGCCGACGSPLVVSSRQPVSLPCPHCGEVVQGGAAEVIVDQWTEPWARVEGGGMDLEYRLVALPDDAGISAGCAVCGAATPAGDPASVCAQCGSVTWVPRGTGRLQLGVRVDGIRADKPFKSLLPIAHGEGMLRGDALRGTSGRSGSSLASATGVGCAVAVAAIVLVVLGVWMAATLVHC